MPLNDFQKRWVIEKSGYNPEEYQLNDDNSITPKVKTQPIVSDTTFQTKVEPSPTPRQDTFGFTGTAVGTTAHNIPSALAGGYGFVKGMRLGSKVPGPPIVKGGAGILTGVAAATGAGGLTSKLQSVLEQPLVKKAQELEQTATDIAAPGGKTAVELGKLLLKLNRSQQERPGARLTGEIASIPFSGVMPSPTRVAQAGKYGIPWLLGHRPPVEQIPNIVNVGVGAALQPAIATGRHLATEGELPSIGELGKETLLGALFNKPNILGRKFGMTDIPTTESPLPGLEQTIPIETAPPPTTAGALNIADLVATGGAPMSKGHAPKGRLTPRGIEALAKVQEGPVKGLRRPEEGVEPQIETMEAEGGVQVTPPPVPRTFNLPIKLTDPSPVPPERALVVRDPTKFTQPPAQKGYRFSEEGKFEGSTEDAPLGTDTAFERNTIKLYEKLGRRANISVWFDMFKKWGASMRNVRLEADGNIVDYQGNPVAGQALLKQGLGEVVAKLNPEKMGAETIPHEMFHAFYHFLKQSPRSGDLSLVKTLENTVQKDADYQRWRIERMNKRHDASIEEFITTEQGAEFLRRNLNLEGETGLQTWYKDFAAHLKTRFTKDATTADFRRLMQYRFQNDPAFSNYFKTGKLSPVGRVTTTSEEEPKFQHEDPTSETKLPDIIPGQRLIKIKQPDGKIIDAITDDNYWEFPGKGKMLNVGRVVEDKWSHGPIRPGEEVVKQSEEGKFEGKEFEQTTDEEFAAQAEEELSKKPASKSDLESLAAKFPSEKKELTNPKDDSVITLFDKAVKQTDDATLSQEDADEIKKVFLEQVDWTKSPRIKHALESKDFDPLDPDHWQTLKRFYNADIFEPIKPAAQVPVKTSPEKQMVTPPKQVQKTGAATPTKQPIELTVTKTAEDFKRGMEVAKTSRYEKTPEQIRKEKELADVTKVEWESVDNVKTKLQAEKMLGQIKKDYQRQEEFANEARDVDTKTRHINRMQVLRLQAGELKKKHPSIALDPDLKFSEEGKFDPDENFKKYPKTFAALEKQYKDSVAKLRSLGIEVYGEQIYDDGEAISINEAKRIYPDNVKEIDEFSRIIYDYSNLSVGGDSVFKELHKREPGEGPEQPDPFSREEKAKGEKIAQEAHTIVQRESGEFYNDLIDTLEERTGKKFDVFKAYSLLENPEELRKILGDLDANQFIEQYESMGEGSLVAKAGQLQQLRGGALFDDIMRKNQPSSKFRGFNPFRSEITKIEQLDSPEAKKVSKAFTGFYEQFDKYKGRFTNDVVDKLLNFIDYTNPKEAFVTNNKDMDAVVNYLYDKQDKGSSSITLTPEQIKIEKIVRENLLNTAREKNTFATLRKIIPDPNYLPQIPSRKALDVFLNKPGTAEHKKLIDDWYNYYTKVKGLSKEKADKALKIFKAGYTKQQVNLAQQFGPIDETAGIGIPRSWRENNLVDIMTRFNNRYARRLAYHKLIETNKEVQSALNDPAKGLAASEPVKNVAEDIAGVTEHEEAKRTAIAGLVRAAMLGPLTGAKDFTANLTLGMQHQTLGQAVQSPLHAWTRMKQNIKDSFRAGVNRHNIAALEFGEGGIEDAILFARRLRDVVNTVQGRNHLERWARATAFGQGKFLAMDNLWAAKKGRLSNQGRKFLDDFGPENWRDFREKGEFTPEILEDIASKYTRSVQGSYDYRGLPALTQRGSLAPVLSLARWNVEKFNNFLKYNIEPAKKGNLTPLLMSTLGMLIGGTAVTALVEQITGRKSKTPTLKELETLAKEGENITMPTAYKLAGLSSMAGYAGIMGDVIRSALDYSYGKTQPQIYDNPLIIGIESVSRNMFNAAEAMSQGDFDIGTDFMSQMMEDLFQAYRIALPYASAEKKADIERANKLRDQKLFRITHDYPVPRGGFDRPNPFLNRDIKEFKRTSDINEAVEMVPSLIQDAVDKSEGDFDRLQSKLRNIKQNSYMTMPNPERSLLTFKKYYDFLVDTQGKEEADKRLNDFLQQNLINKTKSSLVPSL